MKTSQKAREMRALKMAVGLYAIVFALKVGVYFITGVMALLAEALHTLSDILISGFLLGATIWSSREADEVHMFGYGRAQNVAALVAATLFISFTSLRLYEEAIPRLFQTEVPGYQNLPLAMGVLVVSMGIAAAPTIMLFRQKKRGAAAKAQLRELFNDQLGLIAALIGTILISMGQPIADPIAAIVVATVIAVSAIDLFRENSRFLIGRSPGAEFLARVESSARSVDGVLDVHDMRAEYIGPDVVHVDMHISVKAGTPIEEANRIAEAVRKRVHGGDESSYCAIHVDEWKGSG